MDESSNFTQKKAVGQGLHPLWREVKDPDGRTFYVNPFSGRLSHTRFAAPGAPSGGILCDEMGLGKTVELLACIAANRFKGVYKVRPLLTLPLSCLRSERWWIPGFGDGVRGD